jgi:hypothetical protein
LTIRKSNLLERWGQSQHGDNTSEMDSRLNMRLSAAIS